MSLLLTLLPLTLINAPERRGRRGQGRPALVGVVGATGEEGVGVDEGEAGVVGQHMCHPQEKREDDHLRHKDHRECKADVMNSQLKQWEIETRRYINKSVIFLPSVKCFPCWLSKLYCPKDIIQYIDFFHRPT